MIRRTRMTVAQLKKHLDTRLNRMDRRNGKRFSAIDARFASMDARFESMDARFEANAGSVDKRFVSMAARFESIDEKLDVILGFVKNTYEHTTRILDDHEHRLQRLERR